MNFHSKMEELHGKEFRTPENAKETAKRRIYISGSISGRPLDVARRHFESAEASLRAQGWETVNPLRNGLPEDAPWSCHIAVDILSLLGCSAIYLLRGWQASRGAQLEANIARLTDKAIYYETMDDADHFGPIFDAVTNVLDIDGPQLQSKDREQRLVFARMIFSKHAREQGASFPEIGRALKHHHSTVVYWLQQYGAEYAQNKVFKIMADKVSEYLKSC